MTPATLGILIPIIAIAGSYFVGIIKTMTKHQQRMAELYQQNAHAADPRLERLQQDIADLKDLVHQQTIALDRLTTPLPGAEIRERIGN